MIVDLNGIPIEFFFTPGSMSDTRVLDCFHLNLKKDSIIYGDKAYNNYQFEDLLFEISGIKLVTQRKKNSNRPHKIADEFRLSSVRQRVETTFSSIISLMPRCIKSTTPRGFFLKIFFFIIGYMSTRIFAKI